MNRVLLCLGASLTLFACSDPLAPPADRAPAPAADVVTTQTLFAKYVAIGTSVSMGVQAAGIYDDAQMAAWPAQLAALAGGSFSLPLIQDPGCPPPLASPLAIDVALIDALKAFGGGGDLIGALGGVCKPLQDGVTLPTSNLAISGANVHDALTITPEIAASLNLNLGRLYSRVLPPGKTQVSAMTSESPSFVSVELATNEILPASDGQVSALTPYSSWQPDYDNVIDAVKSTGAQALIVGLPHDARRFPSLRTSREFFSQWPVLLLLGIRVSWTCYFSSNYLFIPGYVLDLLSKAPTTATCANVPGTDDYVLTPSDMNVINALMAKMNQHMQGVASANGWPYFDLSVVYDQPKVAFNMWNVLFSDEPFGPYMSLDGVHPNTAGQTVIANAAAAAIESKYAITVP